MYCIYYAYSSMYIQYYSPQYTLFTVYITHYITLYYTMLFTYTGNDRIDLNIEPGMISGIELIVQAGINQGGMLRDIIFRINEISHTTYKRQNSDLLLDLTITLSEALFGFQRNITFLNNSILSFQSPVNTIISTDSVFALENCGMYLIC